MEITGLLRHTVEVGASDLHLKAGNVPFVRVEGEMSATAFGAMSAADTEAAALALMPEHKRREFEATSEADFGYTLAGVGRFRINVFRQRSMVGLAIRRVRSDLFKRWDCTPVVAHKFSQWGQWAQLFKQS